MREILQGQIKADSKDVGAAPLCLHLGGRGIVAFSVRFVGPVPMQTRLFHIM